MGETSEIDATDLDMDKLIIQSEVVSVKDERCLDEKIVDVMQPYARKIKALFAFFLTLFLVVSLFNHTFMNVYPGEKGVLWKRFDNGTESRLYDEGLHVINPFNVMYRYDTRIQQRETNFSVLSSNGLPIQIKASVRFNPIRDQVHLLHRIIGPNYIDTVVIPETQAVIRRVIGEYEPQTIYSTQRDIAQNVFLSVSSELRQNYIRLDDLLITEIKLPKLVAEAIEAKLLAELTKNRSEALKKR